MDDLSPMAARAWPDLHAQLVRQPAFVGAAKEILGQNCPNPDTVYDELLRGGYIRQIVNENITLCHLGGGEQPIDAPPDEDVGGMLAVGSASIAGKGTEQYYPPDMRRTSSYDPEANRRGFVNLYMAGWRGFIDYGGRAGPAQFWLFMLINTAFLMIATWAAYSMFWPTAIQTLGIGSLMNVVGIVNVVFFVLELIYFVGFILPISMRRLHDAGFKGLWLLLPLGTSVLAVVLLLLTKMAFFVYLAPLGTVVLIILFLLPTNPKSKYG